MELLSLVLGAVRVSSLADSFLLWFWLTVAVFCSASPLRFFLDPIWGFPGGSLSEVCWPGVESLDLGSDAFCIGCWVFCFFMEVGSEL